MSFRKLVHSIAAVLTCVWILLSNSMPCVAAPSCDGAIFLRTEGPYKYGQEVAVRVIISPEIHYPDGQVDVFSARDKRYCVMAEDLGDGVWDAKIRIPLQNDWNRKIGFRLWQGEKLVCEKTKPINMKAEMVMDIKGPEWSCAGYPAEYELTMGGASLLSIHWDFGQEERNTMVNAQGRDVQRIRWKSPGEKSVIATIRASGHPLQSRLITTPVAPENGGMVVEGPRTVQQGDLKEWKIVVPPMGPRHMAYHIELEVDWGQGETSRYVNRNSRFEIRKRFVRPGTYTVGLRLLERNVSLLLKNNFIVKVIENRPTLDLQVTGPQQVTAGTPAFWTAQTTRGRPPYEFWVRLWDRAKLRTLLSESNIAKFNLNLSTPGKNKLTFQVVDADGIASDWHEVKVLVTPEKDEATVVNNTQGGNTSTTGGTIKKDPPPDSGQQNGSGSGATPVGDPTGSPDIYGGLVIKGPARVSVDASARLKALDHGGRAYASATWDSSNTEVLRVSSSSGWVQGLKPGHATVIVHVDDMRAYHDIEVVKGPVNPFQDAVDDLKKDPNVKVVVKKPPPDGDEADEQGVDTGSDGGDSQSNGPDDDSDDLDSIEMGGVSADSDDEEDAEEPFNPFLDAVDDPKKDPDIKVVVKKPPSDGEEADEQGVDIGSDGGDSQSNGPDDDSDNLDSIEMGGVSADSDDEEDAEDDLGFKMIGHKHEPINKGGSGPFGVSTDPPATTLADPYDLTGTWYLVNSYYAGENLGATHISPAWAQKSAVVRIEPRKDRYVGKIVRDGELPGIESHWYKHAIRWRKGQEVLWVERKGKDTYEGQIMRHSRLTDRIYVIFKVEGKRARICANAHEGMCQRGLNIDIRYARYALGFRISSGDNVGRYKRTPESDSINLFGTEVGD